MAFPKRQVKALDFGKLVKLRRLAQAHRMNDTSSSNDQPRIYLINVGANSSHESRARSPLFVNNPQQHQSNFLYVPFYCANKPELATKEYPASCQSFLNPRHLDGVKRFAHVDPDWENLTYGDCCDEPRGATLKNARVNDIFLFWGALITILAQIGKASQARRVGTYSVACDSSTNCRQPAISQCSNPMIGNGR